jgi:exopolysaccharide production protein ExoQ
LVAVSAVSVLLGRKEIDPLSDAVVFVGVFASKNQLGFFSSLMLIISLALMIDPRQPLPARLLGIGATLLALPLVYLSRSATSLISVAVAVAVLILGLLFSRLDRFGRARVLLVSAVMLMLAALPLLAAGDDAIAFALDMLGKNATLTGRTTLWHYAATMIAERPLLGCGFQAFWVRNSVDAESLWSWLHVLSRTGFHFHNTYIEAAVELGCIGASILVVTFVAILIGIVRWSWQERSAPAASFVAVMVCLLVRALAEVDALQSFQIGTFILGVTATYAAMKPRSSPP